MFVSIVVESHITDFQCQTSEEGEVFSCLFNSKAGLEKKVDFRNTLRWPNFDIVKKNSVLKEDSVQ